jgi:hypothetical protein
VYFLFLFENFKSAKIFLGSKYRVILTPRVRGEQT